MRVFITGGTGFIGQELIAHLRRAGHAAVVMSRTPEQACTMFGPEVEVVNGREPSEIQEAVRSADGVVNLAGEPVLPGRWTAEKRSRLVESRVGLTERLVEMMGAVDPRPKVLVSASAVGFYGHDAGAEPRPETSPAGDDFLARLCVDWETAARGAKAHDVRVCCVRIGLVLGPRGGALNQMLGVFRAGLGGRIGPGTQMMPWIHLDDLVRLFVAAIEDPSFPSVVNGTAPVPVTNRAFTQALGQVLNRPTVLPVPSLALKAVFGQAATALLGGQNAIPAAAEAHGFTFRFREMKPCLEDILSKPR